MEKQIFLAVISVFIFEASQAAAVAAADSNGTVLSAATTPSLSYSTSPAKQQNYGTSSAAVARSWIITPANGFVSKSLDNLSAASVRSSGESHIAYHTSPSDHATDRTAVSAGMGLTSVMPWSNNVKICFKFDIMEPWEEDLSNRTSDMFVEQRKYLTQQIQELYKDVNFDMKYVIFENFTKNGENVSASLCGVFGPKLSASVYVDETFAKELADGTLGEIPINKKSYQIEIRGVITGSAFKAKDGECKRVCCGMGGPFTVEKTCSPSFKCRGIRLNKETDECLSHCVLEDCLSSGNTLHISKTFLLLQLVSAIWLMAWA